MKVNEILQNDMNASSLGKQVRAIATACDLTATQHQNATRTFFDLKKSVNADFVLKLRGKNIDDRAVREAEFLKRVKEFVIKLNQSLKQYNVEYTSDLPTDGSLVDNWKFKGWKQSAVDQSNDDKIFKNLTLTRISHSNGEQEERLETSHPEAWVKLQIKK